MFEEYCVKITIEFINSKFSNVHTILNEVPMKGFSKLWLHFRLSKAQFPFVFTMLNHLHFRNTEQLS